MIGCFIACNELGCHYRKCCTRLFSTLSRDDTACNHEEFRHENVVLCSLQVLEHSLDRLPVIHTRVTQVSPEHACDERNIQTCTYLCLHDAPKGRGIRNVTHNAPI